MRGTTLAWKFAIVDSQRPKRRGPPQSAEEVYRAMLDLGLSLSQPSDDPKVEAQRVAKAEKIAKDAAAAWQKKHDAKKKAEGRGTKKRQ